MRALDGGAHDPLQASSRIGLAVSGGPDSLALLLLARALMPDRIEAATFDHGLRPESAAEAEQVGALCRALGVPHSVLRGNGEEHPRGSLQALARGWRYAALGRWCGERGLGWLLTAHHADDQAETVLMRLARGSGTAGLAGIRPVRRAQAGAWTYRIGRPLLGFSKAELADIVRSAGIEAADDPSNRSPRFDRTRARALLARTDWLDPRRLAATADHMREAEEALDWAARRLWDERARPDRDAWLLDPAGLPEALRRRLCAMALARFGEAPAYTGPELSRFVDRLAAGGHATLAGVKARGGETWRFAKAAPRRAP